jgi:hypothetical protein
MTPNRPLSAALLAAALLASAPTPALAEVHPSRLYYESQSREIQGELGDIASGLEHALKTDDVRAATRLYKLERKTIDLLVMTPQLLWDRPGAAGNAQAGLRATLARIYQLQERVQQFAIGELDRVLPGEPQRAHWAREERDLYRPLFRLGTPKPGEPQRTREQALADMQARYVEGGGTPSSFQFLSRKGLRNLVSGQLAEWVQFGRDRVRTNTAGAKHPLLAMGRSVRGAGSMKVYKNDQGKVVLVVVSNSSGNYKPGPGSTEGPVQRLIRLGVNPAHILVTSIVPEEPELVKLLLKSKLTLNEDQIRDRVKHVRAQAAPAPRPGFLMENRMRSGRIAR